MKHLDFLEIGTSDFSAEIQTCDDSTVGLSVDPLQYYLDRLPSKPNVIKVCCAVSDQDSNDTKIFYVKESDIIKYNLPYWVRGCNSIHHPHPTVSKLLKEHGYDANLITQETVPQLSFLSLLDKYNVEAIDYLKLDTEGHDCVIMTAVAETIRSGRILPPKKICFETNVLSNSADQKNVISIFCTEFHYRIEQQGVDTILVQ